MLPFIQHQLQKIQKPTRLQVLHQAIKPLLFAQGYRWEEKRSGELRIGYWKKVFRKKEVRKAYPKRFVLIPGLGDSSVSWLSVLTLSQPVLRQQFDELILFDFPGFGGFLAREKAFPSLELMMKGVGDILDYLKPDTLFGHSLGGWLAGHYAVECGLQKRPESNRLNYSGPSRLLLAAPSGVYPDSETMEQLKEVFHKALKEGFPHIRPYLFAQEPFWFKYVAEQFHHFFDREDIAQFIYSARPEHSLHEQVQHIQAPVWLIWGEHDALIPARCAESWMRNFNESVREKSHTVLLKGLGHSPQLENSTVFAAVLAQVLMGKVPHDIGKRWWRTQSGQSSF
jgi:pimeloyl-ACP methyl ester carboxylesterase